MTISEIAAYIASGRSIAFIENQHAAAFRPVG